MKKLLLSGMAALLLAIGTAHAQNDESGWAGGLESGSRLARSNDVVDFCRLWLR